MARWLLIPLKESSGCGPVVGIAALVIFFVGGMLVGLTGELIQVQVLGNTPIKERGTGASFLIGGIVWLVFGLVVYIIVRRRRRR